MRIPPHAFSLLFVGPFSWTADWAWGLPLIVLTVVIHVSGLALFGQAAVHVAGRVTDCNRPRFAFILVVGASTLFAACLHGLEVTIWAVTYRLLGALPDLSSSVLYSLNAMTSYGHESLTLAHRWQLMGALEALNGWLLFGLTTAFLFGVVQKLWLLANKGRPAVL